MVSKNLAQRALPVCPGWEYLHGSSYYTCVYLRPKNQIDINVREQCSQQKSSLVYWLAVNHAAQHCLKPGILWLCRLTART